MKYFIYILLATATALIFYNATKLDYNSLLDGNSKTALFSILASGSAILLLIILLISRKIERKKDGHT